VREGDRKLIRTPRPSIMHSDARFSVAPLEVFDLAADPAETRDLSGSLTPPEVRLVVEVEHRAERGLHASSGELTDTADLPESLHEQLRSLGYAK